MESLKRNLILRSRKDLQKFERFIEDVCEQQNVTQEYFGNIFLASMEVAEILFSFTDINILNSLSVKFERSVKGIIFNFVILHSGEEQLISTDIVDREIRRHKLDRELLIAKTLADEMAIDPDGHGLQLLFHVNGISFEKACERVNLLKSFWSSTAKVIQKG